MAPKKIHFVIVKVETPEPNRLKLQAKHSLNFEVVEEAIIQRKHFYVKGTAITLNGERFKSEITLRGNNINNLRSDQRLVIVLQKLSTVNGSWTLVTAYRPRNI